MVKRAGKRIVVQLGEPGGHHAQLRQPRIPPIPCLLRFRRHHFDRQYLLHMQRDQGQDLPATQNSPPVHSGRVI